MIEITFEGILVLCLTAVMIIIMLYTLHKRKKNLTCIKYPFLSLVDVRGEVRDKIKINYAGDLVENLSMMKVKVKNRGNIPIRPEKIVKPLEFDFGENLKVIDYNVSDTKRETRGINVELKYDTGSNLIKCYFDLLNQKDEFTIKFLCSGVGKEYPKINARIEGIKQVDVITIDEERVESMNRLGNFYMTVGVLLLIYAIIAYFFSGNIKGCLSVGAFPGILLIISAILAKKIPYSRWGSK